MGKGTTESIVHAVLQLLRGTVIYENADLGSGKRYVLSALGLLLTDAGPEIEYVLAQYLEHVKHKYVETSGAVTKVSLEEASAQIGFTADQLYLLKRAMSVFYDFHGGGSYDDPYIPLCVDDLALVEDGDFQAYVRDHEFQKFDPTVPTNQNPFIYNQRRRAELRSQVEHKAWISELTAENFLAVYDVVLDIRQEFQLSDKAEIPLQTQIVRPGFEILLPANTINMRDRNCELRWKAVAFLKKNGIVGDFEVIESYHRWDTRLRVKAEIPTFNAVAAIMDEEYERRVEPDAPTKQEGAISSISNPWISGTFYLLCFVVTLTSLGVISRMVAPVILPVVVIGGILAVTIIGALQLRNNNVLKDETFTWLMIETLKRLPLLRRIGVTDLSEKQVVSTETRSS